MEENEIAVRAVKGLSGQYRVRCFRDNDFRSPVAEYCCINAVEYFKLHQRIIVNEQARKLALKYSVKLAN